MMNTPSDIEYDQQYILVLKTYCHTSHTEVNANPV